MDDYVFKKGDASKTVCCPGGVKRRFDDLMSHRKEIVRDSGRIEAFQAFFEVVKDCLGELTPPKDEMLGRVKWKSNKRFFCYELVSLARLQLP